MVSGLFYDLNLCDNYLVNKQKSNLASLPFSKLVSKQVCLFLRW
jgi:hypothetical protein